MVFGNKQTSGIRGKAMAAHDRECPHDILASLP